MLSPITVSAHQELLSIKGYLSGIREHERSSMSRILVVIEESA
jgi:hypothetical protein